MEKNLFDISHKVIIITGGGGVLGGAMGSYLAGHGAKIVILSRSESSSSGQAEKIIAAGGQAISFAADVLSEEKLREVREKILQTWGGIDVLINAAGGNMPGATVPTDGTVFDISTSDLQKVMDLNLMGSVLPTLIFGKTMAEQKSGSIINISSMASTHAITRVLGYSLAKSAIDMFTKWMAMEMARKFGDGIRVNAIYRDDRTGHKPGGFAAQIMGDAT